MTKTLRALPEKTDPGTAVDSDGGEQAERLQTGANPDGRGFEGSRSRDRAGVASVPVPAETEIETLRHYNACLPLLLAAMACPQYALIAG